LAIRIVSACVWSLRRVRRVVDEKDRARRHKELLNVTPNMDSHDQMEEPLNNIGTIAWTAEHEIVDRKESTGLFQLIIDFHALLANSLASDNCCTFHYL
jgi:hypothetical protein